MIKKTVIFNSHHKSHTDSTLTGNNRTIEVMKVQNLKELAHSLQESKMPSQKLTPKPNKNRRIKVTKLSQVKRKKRVQKRKGDHKD